MNFNNPDKNLIHRYFNGELSGIELENFRERMQSDETFRTEINFQNLLRSGILASKEEELKKKILTAIKFRQTRIPFSLKLIVTFVVVTTIGITLWFYVGKDSSSHKVNLLFPFLSKEKNKSADKKSTKEKVINQDTQSVSLDTTVSKNSKNPGEGLAETKEGVAPEQQNQWAANDSNSEASNEDKDIVIKKDQLLISITLPVNEKSQDKKIPDGVQTAGLTTTQDVAQKLNPAANIPEEEKVAANIEAEFWVSPVNYRGYKMLKNRLILFGIEEPDAVKLYRSNDVLYMKYGNEYFRLVNTFEFLTYQRLKENDIPLAIRQ